jgi:demethylmenaquinone methyltransferase / 2-methoxy-6-polyprenyl-1,4-benzoquinol methylase
MRQGLSIDKIKSIYNCVSHRYDFQHGFVTANSDQRGRRILVEKAVHEGDIVLDAGAGTGRTAFLAAQRVGPDGKVVLFDISEGMLEMAKQKAERFGVMNKVDFHTGDILNLPFTNNHFDVVLSTYSICPLYEPARGALELYRVVKGGGLLGIAHSTEPENKIVKKIADWIEAIVWKFPSLSLGCRSVSVLPALESAGAKVIYEKRIGIPLWPFVVFVVKKSDSKTSLAIPV